MNCLIIEDEVLSAEYLWRLVQRICPESRLIGIVDTVALAKEYLSKPIKPDLLFLDIHLADGLGFDLFDKADLDIPVIFTTAYSEYMIQAFKVNSIDYLLKPVDPKELEHALGKFRRLQTVPDTRVLQQMAVWYRQHTQVYKERFLVRVGQVLNSISVDQIRFIASQESISFITCHDGKRYPIDQTLDQLEQVLDPEQFFRINRRCLLHIRAVTKLVSIGNGRWEIQADFLEGDAAIVSRERGQAFRQWLDR